MIIDENDTINTLIFQTASSPSCHVSHIYLCHLHFPSFIYQKPKHGQHWVLDSICCIHCVYMIKPWCPPSEHPSNMIKTSVITEVALSTDCPSPKPFQVLCAVSQNPLVSGSKVTLSTESCSLACMRHIGLLMLLYWDKLPGSGWKHSFQVSKWKNIVQSLIWLVFWLADSLLHWLTDFMDDTCVSFSSGVSEKTVFGGSVCVWFGAWEWVANDWSQNTLGGGLEMVSVCVRVCVTQETEGNSCCKPGLHDSVSESGAIHEQRNVYHQIFFLQYRDPHLFLKDSQVIVVCDAVTTHTNHDAYRKHFPIFFLCVTELHFCPRTI